MNPRMSTPGQSDVPVNMELQQNYNTSEDDDSTSIFDIRRK